MPVLPSSYPPEYFFHRIASFPTYDQWFQFWKAFHQIFVFHVLGAFPEWWPEYILKEMKYVKYRINDAMTYAECWLKTFPNDKFIFFLCFIYIAMTVNYETILVLLLYTSGLPCMQHQVLVA